MTVPVDDPPPAAARRWLAAPIRLRPEVELLVGADEAPMLFVPGPRTYIRLTPGAGRFVALLDGRSTGIELLGRARAEPAVLRLLEELRRAGALTVPPEPAPARRGALRLLRPVLSRFRWRWPLTRSLDRAVRRPGALLRRVPPGPAAVAMLAAAIAAATVAAVALVRTPADPAASPGLPMLLTLLLVALPLQLLLHEGAHAAGCEALRVPAREAGLYLWFFVLPVPYVDCTDAYRVRSRRGRVAIALAGPFVDLLALGGSATGWLLTGSSAGSAVHVLVLAQLVVLATSLNPLLPGDGTHAVEAATGTRNLRGRAFGTLARLALRRPLPPRPAAGYLAYALLALAYPVAVAALLLRAAGPLV